MEETYLIRETISDKKTTYVPVSMKLKKDSLYVRDEVLPWHKVSTNRYLEKGREVFIVTYIQHSGKDYASNLFLTESEARRYISALGRAIKMRTGADKVEVHFDGGLQRLDAVLDVPVNTYVNFRTPTDEYSITLAKTVV